jgi:hypothetical protein
MKSGHNGNYILLSVPRCLGIVSVCAHEGDEAFSDFA